MAGEKILNSFPFDYSMVLNEESSQMEPDREYDAERYRKYFAKFLSNGVYFGKYKNYGENSMKVSLDEGLTISVEKGAGIIEGADFENEEKMLFTLERPTAGKRIDRVIVKLDKTLAVRETQLYIKQGTGTTTAELQRDDNIYEICLAEITVNSTSNIAENDIKDTRLDNELCGLVNSLVSVDGKEMYQKFQEYIDTVTENLVRKDQDSIINGTLKDKNGGTSKNNFTDAYKNKLDSIANGANKTVIDTSLNSNSTNPVQNKVIYNELSKKPSKDIATTSASGLMSANDKVKLDGIASGANKTVIEDNTDSSSANNALSANQGKYLKNLANAAQSTANNAAKVANSAQETANGANTKVNNVEDTFNDFLQSGGTIYGSLNLVGNFKNQETYSNTVTDASNVYISSNANFRRSSSSSRRYKKDITEKLEERLEPQKLYDLPIVQFKYKKGYLNKDDRRYNENILGFIAEDVAEIYEPAAQYDENGNVEMWNSNVMIPALLYLIKDLNERLKKLEEKIKE